MTQLQNNKQVQVKKKKRRTQVTLEESSQFLARPLQKIEDLDKSLRKSYQKGFFRHSRFQGIKQLKDKLQNNQNDSIEDNEQSEESVFSLHNDQRTLKRREKQKQKKKVVENKADDNITNPDQNYTAVAKPKRSRPKKQTKKTEQDVQKGEQKQKNIKKQQQKKQSSSKSEEESQNSSSESQNSGSDSSSGESQSGSESENQDQKSQEQQKQATESALKKNNQGQDNVQKSKSDQENYSEQNQSQQEQKANQASNKIQNKEVITTKQSFQQPKTIVQQIKAKPQSQSPQEKMITRAKNNKKPISTRKRAKKVSSSQQQVYRPQTLLKKTQILKSVQPSNIEEEIKQKSYSNKIVEELPKQPIQQAVIQKKSQKIISNHTFIIEPTKREHHLEYCPKVIVESLYFRNNYIIAPYLAVSQLSTPYKVPIQVIQQENSIRMKKVIQNIEEQKNIQTRKTEIAAQQFPITNESNESKEVFKEEKNQPIKRLRNRRRR